MCVSNLGTLLCHPLQNNNVKWLSSTYFRERKPQWLIFRMSFWNWTLLVHLSQAQFFRPIFRDLTHYTTKTSPSKTIAVHTRYKSLYISLPSSAKQQREMTKIFCLPGAIIGSPILASDTTWNTKQNRKNMKKSLTLGASNHSLELRLGLKKGRKWKGDVNTIKRQVEHIPVLDKRVHTHLRRQGWRLLKDVFLFSHLFGTI